MLIMTSSSSSASSASYSYRHAAIRSAALVTILFLIFINRELNIETSSSSSSSSSSSDYHYERYEIKQPFDHSHPHPGEYQQQQQSSSTSFSSSTESESVIMTSNGYFNLSCPFEMSKYSCAYMHRGTTKQETVHASMDYYRQRLDMIGEIYRRILEEATTSARTTTTTNKRILMTGDSLLRQLFISIACNAHSIFSVPPHNNNNNTLIADIVIPWQDPWPIVYGPNKAPSIGSGIHGGFGAAYIRLVNGMEIHYVPHLGFNDPTTGETNIIQRLQQDIEKYNGRISFGTKTAIPVSTEDHVDILVYQVGIHYGPGESRTLLNHFTNRISKPLMQVMDDNDNTYVDNHNTNILHDGYETHNSHSTKQSSTPVLPSQRRTRTIYITTPSQHYNTLTGQWMMNMTSQTKQCVDQIPSNLRADQEKKMLLPGVNVDVLLDYDDLHLGSMHVQYGDCSHYCMPGPPDGVAARLMHELLIL